MKLIEYTELWNREKHNGNDNCIYVDIPFCYKICEYCIYKSSLFSEKKMDDYISNILFKWFDIYNQVFDDVVPDSIYFGGGTASILSIEQMSHIFNRMKNFEKIPYKSFEGSIDTLSEEKLVFLLENGFRYFSVGIQSFDKRIINDQNRIYVSPMQLKEIVQKTNIYNDVTISVDLIAFLDELSEKSLAILRQDLVTMCSIVLPDIICIHPNYKKIDLNNIEQYKWITALIEVIVDVMVEYEYVVADSTKDFYQNFRSEPELVEKWGLCAHNIFRKKTVKRSMNNKKYNCSASQIPRQNVFAMGGYENRKLHSYIGGNNYWRVVSSSEQIQIIDI